MNESTPPGASTQTWRSLSSIYICGTLCLPVIIVGQELCHRYGMFAALCAIGVGNTILFLLALATSHIGMRQRKSTPELAVDILGFSGGIAFAIAMIVVMLAWFAIQLNVMSLAIQDIVPLPPLTINLLLGGMITILARSGIQALGRTARLLVPLLAVTLLWATIQAPVPSMLSVDYAWRSLAGVSLVTATAIAVVIDMPTYYRYVRSEADGNITTTLLFLGALPFIEGLGVYLSAGIPGATVLETLQGSGGALWYLWVSLFLVLAGWGTNNTNLFSAVVCAETLMPKVSEAKRTLLLGAAATAAACCNIVEYIEPALNLIGIAIASIGGVLIAAYLVNNLYREQGICE